MIRLFLRALFAILLVASISYAADKAKIIAEDDQYVSYENGIVYDKQANIEWVAGPDKNTTWHEANRWVENLNVAGGGWRMPTVKELKTLYKKGTGSRNMTPLLKTTGSYVWSGETKGSSSAWLFLFYRGNEGWNLRDYSRSLRGFAVRSR